MKTILNFYAGICLLALALKFAVKAITAFRKNKTQLHDHEQEHFYGHLVKLLILVLFAAWFIFHA